MGAERKVSRGDRTPNSAADMLQRAAAPSELSVPNLKSWGSEIDDGRPKHGLLENQVRTVVTKSPIARTCDPASVARILQLSTMDLHGRPSSAEPSLPDRQNIVAIRYFILAPMRGCMPSFIMTVQVIPALTNTPSGTCVKRMRTGMRCASLTQVNEGFTEDEAPDHRGCPGR